MRRFTMADVDLLVELDTDPEVMRWLSGGPPTPRHMIENEILPRFNSASMDGRGYWAALTKDTGAFIGWFSLVPREPAASRDLEIGYRLRRSAWGMGYATEVARSLVDRTFIELGAERVFATTYGENAASRRVMEKLGMTHVRSYRQSAADFAAQTTYDVCASELWDGDDVEYAITRDDWDRQHRVHRGDAEGAE